MAIKNLNWLEILLLLTFLKKAILKRENNVTNKEVKELKEDAEILETMFSSVVDVLEKKKIISDKELDEQIKKRLIEEER